MTDKDYEGLFIIPDEDDTTEIPTLPDVPRYLMPDRMYDVLKWLVLIVLPALSVLIAHIGGDFGMPDPERTAIHITEVALFIGTCIGVSQASAMGR